MPNSSQNLGPDSLETGQRGRICQAGSPRHLASPEQWNRLRGIQVLNFNRREQEEPVKGVSELDAARLDGLLVGELDWPRLGDTELVRDLYCSSVLRLFFYSKLWSRFSFKTLE